MLRGVYSRTLLTHPDATPLSLWSICTPHLTPSLYVQRGAFSGPQLAALVSGMGALTRAATIAAPTEWKRDLLTALQVWRCDL